MNRLVASAALFLATVLPGAAADPAAIAGRYSSFEENGPMLYLDLTHIEGDTFGAVISTIVPMVYGRPGCGGGVEGEVTITGGTGLLSVPNPGAGPTAPKACEVELDFDGDGKIRLTERDGCAGRHAPACAFSGTVTRQDLVPKP